jgi:hypothetical protein
MNYEDDIRIDETALDVEWLEQASLAMKYGRHYAECRRRLTLAEEKIKVLRSELIQEANDDPVKRCNKEKPNAADIEAYYRNDKRHKAAKAEWVEAQFELDIAEVAKNEISFTRKAALEALVTLHGQQWFAGPKMPRDLSFEVQQKQKQRRADQGVSRSINRK